MCSSVSPGWASSRSTRRLRDDADHLAAGGQRRVGEGAHQPDPAAAVDDADPALGEPAPDGPGQLRGRPGSRPALAPQNTQIRRTSEPERRAAAAPSGGRPAPGARSRASRPGVHSPSVRPPGGSDAGSKIGS